MATVTIEGSIAPCGFLARGERATVQLTDDVRALISEGYVDVIAVVDDGDEPPHAPPAEAKPPAKNASREDWAEYLAANTDVVTEGRTLKELQSDYEVWLKTQDAATPPAE